MDSRCSSVSKLFYISHYFYPVSETDIVSELLRFDSFLEYDFCWTDNPGIFRYWNHFPNSTTWSHFSLALPSSGQILASHVDNSVPGLRLSKSTHTLCYRALARFHECLCAPTIPVTKVSYNYNTSQNSALVEEFEQAGVSKCAIFIENIQNILS
jgi:hypothetical protein